MESIRGWIHNLVGGDKKLDASDVKAQIGDLDLDDLKALTFPITKAEVLETLRNNGSSKLLIDAVEKVPQQTFNDLSDLRSKVGI